MSHVPGPSSAPCFSTSKRTENFSRLCQLVMTICSDLFRDILSRYIRPADLRLELNNNKNKLERFLNAQQKEQLYPSSGATTLTAKDLDISVLYILLRNICNIPKHRNGWGNPPLNTDTSLAACIERIRIERNLVTGHSSSGEMDDNVFQDHWDELKDSILEVEKQLTGGDMYKRGVDELLTCDLNPSRAEKYVKQFKSMEGRMDNDEKRLDNVEERLDNVEERLDNEGIRLDNVEERLDNEGIRLDNVEERLDNEGIRLDNVEERLDNEGIRLDNVEERLDNEGIRLDNVEERLDNEGIRLDNVEERLDNEGIRLDNVEEHLDNVDEQHLSTTRQITVRLDNMEEMQMSTTKDMIDCFKFLEKFLPKDMQGTNIFFFSPTFTLLEKTTFTGK